jgi:hypothetical protein
VPKFLRLTAPGAGGGVPPNKGEKSGVATGTPETKLARGLVVVYLEVYRLVIVPYGIMTQIAQKRLWFSIGDGTPTGENETTDIFLDIAAALSAVNRKQYHQFTRSDVPLCYTVTATNIKSAKPLVFVTAANTWTTRNAAKKTAEGWRAQLKNSNIRMSELPTYAKRFRCCFDVGAVSSGAGQQALANHLVPDAGPLSGEGEGTRLFQPYTDPLNAAATITYANSNEIALLMADADDPSTEFKPILCGVSTSDDFGMISEYLKSRRNMREASDPESEFPDADGLMNTLFASSEVLADDVTKAAADYNTNRPYSEAQADEPVWACSVTANTTENRATFSAPLGLLKITGEFGLAAGDEFCVDVEAVYEM